MVYLLELSGPKISGIASVAYYVLVELRLSECSSEHFHELCTFFLCLSIVART